MPIVAVSTQAKHLRQQYRFSVAIAGFNGAYFQKFDRPKIDFDEVLFNGAGTAYAEKLPGRVNFGDVVLEKGVMAEGPDNAVYTWMKQQIDFLTGVGGAPLDFLRDITVTEGDRAAKTVVTYTLRGAWIKSYDGGELNGENSDNVIDSITLAYQNLQIA